MNNSLRLALFLAVVCIGMVPCVNADEGNVKFYGELGNDDERIYEHFAEANAAMLISMRNVVAKNQELINRDPVTGNYFFKGFVPAVVGSQVANDFSLRTGYTLKQAAVRVRNPKNKADEWEEKALKILEKNRGRKGFGEITDMGDKKVYRYMKPLYMERECVVCHSVPEVMPPAVREYIERNYSTDRALGYKEGDLRGGISVIIPITEGFRY